MAFPHFAQALFHNFGGFILNSLSLYLQLGHFLGSGNPKRLKYPSSGAITLQGPLQSMHSKTSFTISSFTSFILSGISSDFMVGLYSECAGARHLQPFSNTFSFGNGKYQLAVDSL